MKKIDINPDRPGSRFSANVRAHQIKKFLDRETGVKWQIRVHENLGWHITMYYGTLSVYPRFSALSEPSFSVMNSTDSEHKGVGDPALDVRSVVAKNLIAEIKRVLKQHYELVRSHMEHYNKHRKLAKKGLFKELI